MNEKSKSRKNLLQSIAIALLSVSAVVLFAQTQLYNLHPSPGYLSSLFSSGTVQNTQSVSDLTDLAAPVRVAVTGPYGRYADLTLTTHDDNFAELGTLLMEALGSAESHANCTAGDFRAALGTDLDYGTSIYFDFLDSLPLSVLAGLVGASWSGHPISACRILLRTDGDAVTLYLWDGGKKYYACPTAITPSTLTQIVGQYQLGSAYFAFDQGEDYQHISPYSLFSDQFSPPPMLTVSGTISDPSALMTALSFNPHTNSRYTESSGAEVVVEGDRTLRIQPDGTISYQGSNGFLSIASKTTSPSETESVVGVYQVLTALLSSTQNSATLYLQNIDSKDNISVLRFGYSCNGLPIRLIDGCPAAEVTVEGTSIIRLTLRLRQYTPYESQSLLLPLAQALSIARKYPGKELAAFYVDSGSSTAVQWLAE